MKCPACTTADLLMTERLGIEIDYCPQCRGVWLDRGELDKIIERSSRESPVPHPSSVRNGPRVDSHQFGNGHGSHDEGHRDNHYDHGKKPFWKELFD